MLLSAISRAAAVGRRRGIVYASTYAPVTHGSAPPEGIEMPAWATVNPEELSGANPAKLQNLVGGAWTDVQAYTEIPDPLNGETFLLVPETQGDELQPFVESAAACPKSGLHNPFKNPSRYIQYGEICHAAGEELSRPAVMDDGKAHHESAEVIFSGLVRCEGVGGLSVKLGRR